MPTVIRRSETLTVGSRRREVRGALGWQVTKRGLELRRRIFMKLRRNT